MTLDYSTFELGLATPKLRDDLRFTLHQSPSGDWYVVEDELNSKFFRVGHAEYTFLSMLDGSTTVQSAVAATAAELEMEAFSETEAAALCKWLVDADLAEKARTDHERWQETQQKKQFAKRMQWLNPIMLKVPLGNPNGFFTRLTRRTGWLVSWPAAIVWCVTVLVALLFLAASTDELFASNSPIVSRDNWLWLGLMWLLLRVVHECAHGVTCKKFGGTVREWGVLLLMFIPLPYVDVTSSWRFPDRRHRILTSAAGMLAEVFLAAIAALIWYHADPGLMKQNALNSIFAAGVTTLLFNANPLMRFDGYHILADVLDAPNLWTHGRAYMRAVGRRFFLGLKTSDPPWSEGHAKLVKSYGIASMVWMVLIFLSLALGALGLLEGFGLLIALVAVVLWLGVPAFRLGRFLLRGSDTEQPNRIQFASRVGGIAVVTALLLWLVPAPSMISAPVVIENDPMTIVRNTAPGFVKRVAVVSGQSVDEGDVLCVLENPDLLVDLSETRLQLQQSELRMRTYQADGEPAAMQYEQESFTDLQRRVSDLEQKSAELTVRAPAAGQVLTGDLQQLIGTYARAGTELVVIGGTEKNKAIALVPQTEADSLQNLGESDLGAKVRVWGRFGGTIGGKVTRISPRAQTVLPHFSFASSAGGPLDVVARQETEETSSEEEGLALAKPHVEIDVELDPDSGLLVSGQTGMLYLNARGESLGAFLGSGFIRYLRDRIQRTHGL